MPLPPFIAVRISPRPLRSLPFGLLLTAILLASSAAFAKGPEQPQRIPLEALGFENISSRYLLSGASMFTLHFVDNQHLLVTFGVSHLMHRLPDCPPDDQDRLVDAVLLELPSGRELARTEWRFHDIGQYLWDLGDGQFLLRQRNSLTTFAPLAQLIRKNAAPFEQHPFLHFDHRIDVILVSPDHSLLSIETSRDPTPEQEAAARALASQNSAPPVNRSPNPVLRRRDPAAPKPEALPTEANPIQISFIRLIRPQAAPASASQADSPSETHLDSEPTPLRARLAGVVQTHQHLQIPLTSEGFLRSTNISDTDVNLYFATFTGKTADLGDFPTSCPPTPTFLSPSEFVAFGCRGTDDALELAGFNIHGDLMWQLNFSDSQAYPSFVSAVPANRFAFSRTLTVGSIFDANIPASNQLLAQEVRVLQTYNGKQLLKVETSPIQRAGQNFALSPDGLALAVIHDPGIYRPGNSDQTADNIHHAPAIEIYKLPALSDKDRHAAQVEAAFAPPPTELPIQFTVREVNQAAAQNPASPTTMETDPKAALVPENTSTPSATAAATSTTANSNASNTTARPAFTRPDSSVAANAPSTSNQAAPSNQADDAGQGDPPPGHRKPPTLYAPGENPSDPDSLKPDSPKPDPQP
jgi:hypothetical protein